MRLATPTAAEMAETRSEASLLAMRTARLKSTSRRSTICSRSWLASGLPFRSSAAVTRLYACDSGSFPWRLSTSAISSKPWPSRRSRMASTSSAVRATRYGEERSRVPFRMCPGRASGSRAGMSERTSARRAGLVAMDARRSACPATRGRQLVRCTSGGTQARHWCGRVLEARACGHLLHAVAPHMCAPARVGVLGRTLHNRSRCVTQAPSAPQHTESVAKSN